MQGVCGWRENNFTQSASQIKVGQVSLFKLDWCPVQSLEFRNELMKLSKEGREAKRELAHLVTLMHFYVWHREITT
jgi:hypothetical protein